MDVLGIFKINLESQIWIKSLVKLQKHIKTSSAQLGSAQRSSAFVRYLVCLRWAQRSSAIIRYLSCLRLGFGILILIWKWSLVFDTPMIQILALHLDLEGEKNINVL